MLHRSYFRQSSFLILFFSLSLCVVLTGCFSGDSAIGPKILGLQLGMSREQALKVADGLLSPLGEKMQGQRNDEDFKKKDEVLSSSGITLIFGGKNDHLVGFNIRNKMLENSSIKWTRPTNEEIQGFIKDISKEQNIPLSDWERTIYGYVYKNNKIRVIVEPGRNSVDAGVFCGLQDN